MNDQEQIEECYKTMYQGMIDKDRQVLLSVLDDSFVLVHMTGMHQPRPTCLISHIERVFCSIAIER